MTICVHKYGPWFKVGQIGKRTMFRRECKKCSFEQSTATTGEKPKE